MTDSAAPDDQLRLEFETPQFLHSLFANEPREISYLEEKLGVGVVTRNGWIVFTGPSDRLKRARQLFSGP